MSEEQKARLEDVTLENMSLVDSVPEDSVPEGVKPDARLLEEVRPEHVTPSGQKLTARVQRTLRSTFAWFARPDDAWANSLLSSAEYSVYIQMDARDREHAVRVARTLLEHHPDAGKLVVRAALLHDCGKLVRPYKLLERIWVGWRVAEPDRDVRLSSAQLGAITSPRPARVGSRRVKTVRPKPLSAADVRRYHPQIGAWLIRAAGGDERVALMVERHHHPGNDQEIIWIHEVDELE